jgi:hypothetical protein
MFEKTSNYYVSKALKHTTEYRTMMVVSAGKTIIKKSYKSIFVKN